MKLGRAAQSCSGFWLHSLFCYTHSQWYNHSTSFWDAFFNIFEIFSLLVPQWLLVSFFAALPTHYQHFKCLSAPEPHFLFSICNSLHISSYSDPGFKQHLIPLTLNYWYPAFDLKFQVYATFTCLQDIFLGLLADLSNLASLKNNCWFPAPTSSQTSHFLLPYLICISVTPTSHKFPRPKTKTSFLVFFLSLKHYPAFLTGLMGKNWGFLV